MFKWFVQTSEYKHFPDDVHIGARRHHHVGHGYFDELAAHSTNGQRDEWHHGRRHHQPVGVQRQPGRLGHRSEPLQPGEHRVRARSLRRRRSGHSLEQRLLADARRRLLRRRLQHQRLGEHPERRLVRHAARLRLVPAGRQRGRRHDDGHRRQTEALPEPRLQPQLRLLSANAVVRAQHVDLPQRHAAGPHRLHVPERRARVAAVLCQPAHHHAQ